MNPAQVGKVLALVSPALAVGVVCFMLFATGYSQVSMEERAGSEGDPVEAASESGWMSAYEYSLRGWGGLVWACAGLLGVLSILGAMSIGGMVAPLVLVLFVSAILLSFSWPEGS